MCGQCAAVQEEDRPLPAGSPVEVAKTQTVYVDVALVRQGHLVEAEPGADRSRLQMIAIFFARQAHDLGLSIHKSAPARQGVERALARTRVCRPFAWFDISAHLRLAPARSEHGSPALKAAREHCVSARRAYTSRRVSRVASSGPTLRRKEEPMAYDLLIKNGLIVDGSGMPAFRGDVGIKNGKIVEIGKLSGAATRTIDAEGRAVAPGFIDNHCHYDAQVTWDPLCTFSPEHGATTVIFGNCSLSLAPVRKGTEERLAEFLSYVEAIPMEVLRTVDFDWETTGQYMDRLDKCLGINVGNLIGHTAVRHYVMGDECQKPGASDNQINAMQDVVRDGMKAGALGLSVSREKGHYDPQGCHIPALWADEKEIFALGDVLREMGTGTIQAGGGQYVELKDGMIRRLAEATGRTVVYNSLSQTMRKPDEWKVHMARVEETAALGIRAYPMCSPNRVTQDFTMKNCQVFRGLPTWHPILLSSDEEKMNAYADPEIRARLHEEAVVNKPEAAVGFSKT
ncbi:MAG: hypothetical protein E6G90_04050, partial [Alphaproteobacteria bacterium]